MQQAMYFPCRGSHLTIMLAGSNTLFVISATLSCLRSNNATRNTLKVIFRDNLMVGVI